MYILVYDLDVVKFKDKRNGESQRGSCPFIVKTVSKLSIESAFEELDKIWLVNMLNVNKIPSKLKKLEHI